MAQVGRIGVWNTAFLGDAVLTLPLLQSLRGAYPDSPLDFWVRKGLGPLFAAHPAVSRVLEYDKRGADKSLASALGAGWQLGREGYSLWVSAHASLRSGLIGRWSSAKIRIGYDAPWFNAWFYTHTVPRRFADLEEIERLLQLLGPLDLPGRGITPDTWPMIALPQSARDGAAAFFASLPGAADNVPVLGLHPGSIWGTKRWTAEGFASVAAKAAREGAQVLLFAGPGEEAMAAAVKTMACTELGHAGERALTDLSGRLSLPELAAYIGCLSCYLTNDSGPMHLAWPQRVPVTAVFGPTVRKWGFFPRGEHSSVIEVPLDCRPCGLHGPQVCPLGHHNCMKLVTPDMVWADVKAKLFGKAPLAGR